MKLNKYLKDTRSYVDKSERWLDIRPNITCKDGFKLSVQASDAHYCGPRNNHGPYSSVEVGYPSERVEEFMPYAEDKKFPANTVYGWVPIEIVEAVIEKHGGIAT